MLPKRHVAAILSEAKILVRGQEILRFAQNDNLVSPAATLDKTSTVFTRNAICALMIACLCACTGCWRTPAAAPAREEQEFVMDASAPPPKFHLPPEVWLIRHMGDVVSGKRSRYQCVLCHDPERDCEQCHEEKGVPRRAFLKIEPGVTITAAPLPKAAGAKP